MAVARTMLLRLQADASQYTKTMQMATKEQQILRKELDLWSVQSKKAVGSSAYLKKELEMQKQQQQFLQVQVKRTNTELETQAKKYGEDSRQAQNLRSKLIDLQLQQEKVNKTIKDAPKQIFKQQTAEIGGKIKNVGIGMAAAVTAPIVGAGVGIYKTGEIYQQAYNKIRVGTGAKDSAFDGLKDSFKNVYAQVASSSDLVAMAIADLNTRVGVTGEALEKLAVQELRFSKLTNTDLKETIKGSTRVFGDWSIPVAEQTKTLDKLYKVTQLTGVSSQQLMEQLVFFGAPLRSMGINFGEAAALIGKFEKEGVNAELVLTSMRRAAVNMSKAGVTDISGGFAGAVQNIKNAKTDAEAMKIAIDIFGARSANDMMRAIRENRFELGELFKALNDNSDSLGLAAAETATYGGKMEKLKHQIQNAVEPLGISFVEAVKSSMPMIEAGANKLKSLIDKFTALPDATKKSVIGIAIFAAVIGPALTSIGYMIMGLSGLKKAFDIAASGVKLFATALTAPVTPAGIIITAILATAGALLYLYNTNEDVRKGMDSAWSWLSDTLPQYMTYMSGKISAWDSDMYGGFAKWYKGVAQWLNKMGVTVNPNILYIDVDKEVEKYNATKKVKPIVGDFVFKPSSRSLGGDIKKAVEDAQKMIKNPINFAGGNVNPIDISSNFDDKAKSEADKMADAIKGVRDAVASYMDKLKSATDTTQQFVGMFDRFQNKAISLSKLLRNMSVNRDTMINWQGNISKLQNSGLNSAFLQELIKKGVSGANEVKSLAKSTPEQIAQLNSLWADQRWNAGNIASMQLGSDPVITRQTVNQTIKIDIHGNEIKDEGSIDSLVDRIVEALSRKGVLVNG